MKHYNVTRFGDDDLSTEIRMALEGRTLSTIVRPSSDGTAASARRREGRGVGILVTVLDCWTAGLDRTAQSQYLRQPMDEKRGLDWGGMHAPQGT
jgi:hypothetical protein